MIIELTEQEVNTLLQLLNSIAGVESVKLILPIYEKIKEAQENTRGN